MPIITIRRSGTAKSIRGKVRNESGSFDHKLTFDEDGETTLDLPVGRYRLGCVATGKAGADFEVAVTDPAASQCSVAGTIPSSGFDFGAVRFRAF